jgi:hypothetical protein
MPLPRPRKTPVDPQLGADVAGQDVTWASSAAGRDPSPNGVASGPVCVPSSRNAVTSLPGCRPVDELMPQAGVGTLHPAHVGKQHRIGVEGVQLGEPGLVVGGRSGPERYESVVVDRGGSGDRDATVAVDRVSDPGAERPRGNGRPAQLPTVAASRVELRECDSNRTAAPGPRPDLLLVRGSAASAAIFVICSLSSSTSRPMVSNGHLLRRGRR